MINRFVFPLILVLVIGFIYYLGAITAPFVIAAVLAYVFQPVVSYMERFKIPRWVGALIVTSIVLAVIALFFIYTAPILYNQLTKLILQVPGYIRGLQGLIHNLFETLSHRVPLEYYQQIQNGIQAMSVDLIGWLLAKTQSAFQGGVVIIHYVVTVLLVPVLAFYLMKDWPNLLSAISYYIPPQNKKVIIQQAQKVDETLASFARGQAMVCLVLAAYYSVALHILGLDFGGFIGSLTGLFAFIPYVGAILGFTVSAIIAISQVSPWLLGESGSLALFGAVTVIFACGQFLEGVVLSPNIVGKSIRLHPLWIMFALFLGGYLFGFAGVLVATPVAGAIGVLCRYALGQYREKMHSLYYGHTRRRGSHHAPNP